MGKFKRFALAVTASLMFSTTAALAEKWDMPTAYAADVFHSDFAVLFAGKVKEYTKGEIDITVHPGGSLLGGGDIMRAVRAGQVPIGERLMSSHATEVPLLGWDNLPFLATTYEDNAKLWSAARERVGERLAEINLVALYTCPWAGQGLYFKKEVDSSADIKGTKFRSYSSTTAALVSELGMTPVQTELAELRQALEKGVVDGCVSAAESGYDLEVSEYLTHFYNLNAWLPRNYVIINKGVYESLSDGNRLALHRAADETGALCAAKSEELADWYVSQLERSGVMVKDAGPGFLGELRAIGAKLRAEWIEATGDDGRAIIDAYGKM